MRPDEMTLEEQLVASIAVANHRKQQEQEKPMDKVTFETNVPQSLALKYANGKRVESRFNEYEVYYTTTDGRALYASPALDQKIVAFEPQAGVPFSICKREVKEGNKKRIEWQVLPVAGAQTEKPAIAAPAPVVATQSTPAPSSLLPTQNTPAPAPIAPRGTMTQLMGGALIASIDALMAAQQYAKSKGWALDFNEEDVRATAASIFIQFGKEQEQLLRYGAAQAPAKVNGGAAWQQ